MTNPTGVLAQYNSSLGKNSSIELDNAFYVEDGVWLESLTIASTIELDYETLVEDISGVTSLYTQPLPTTASGTHVQRAMAFVNEPYPFILGSILRQNGVPNRIILKGGRVHTTITVTDWEQFREMSDDIDEKFGAFEIKSVTETDRPGEPLDSGRITEVLISKLSDKMLTILNTAYTMGYFKVPRESNAENVANALDIQPSTFSERIRKAENTLFEIIFGARE